MTSPRDTHAVAQANIAMAKRGYAAMNEAYAKDSVEPLKPVLAELWAEDGAMVTSGRLFPEAGEWPGAEGMLRFARQQMEAFERMWVEPLAFTEAGDNVLVRVRLGGIARHTGISMDFEVFHVFRFRDGKVTRLEAHVAEEDARRAAGLPAAP
jgi:ketosteroid isomerase-like protein